MNWEAPECELSGEYDNGYEDETDIRSVPESAVIVNFPGNMTADIFPGKMTTDMRMKRISAQSRNPLSYQGFCTNSRSAQTTNNGQLTTDN